MVSDFRSPLIVANMKTNFENYLFMRQLNKEGFYKNFEEDIENIKLIIGVGNQTLYW